MKEEAFLRITFLSADRFGRTKAIGAAASQSVISRCCNNSTVLVLGTDRLISYCDIEKEREPIFTPTTTATTATMTKSGILIILLILCGLHHHLTASFHVPWTPPRHVIMSSARPPFSRLFSTSADEDWRAFRARLVMMNNMNNNHNDTKADSVERSLQLQQQQDNDETMNGICMPAPSSSSWAYDAGLLVEKGSIVLSRVESQLGCPDLDQPYFVKCVVLVVEHDDEITQGIILNRPTDLRLDSEGNVLFGVDHQQEDSSAVPFLLEEFAQDYNNDNELAKMNKKDPNEWRLFFGGEISSMQDEEDSENDDDDDDDEDDGETLIVCLHNMTSPAAQRVSAQILPGVYMTSHSAARSLVQSGDATPDAFYVFYGFCGWDPDQLQTEVQNGSWYLASTDPQTLWDDLAVMRDESYDARAAGLEMWDNLIHKLGKQKEVQIGADNAEDQRDFSELMLKEWVTQTLVDTEENGSGIGTLDDASIFRALQAADKPPIQPGSLLRGSIVPESPYLLKDQFLHKSTVLFLKDDEEASIGMILNLPTADTLSVQINNNTVSNFTIRYGGPSGVASESTDEENDSNVAGDNRDDNEGDQDEPMIWLHCSAGLKFLRTGKPLVAGDENGVWTCTLDQVITAIDLGFASVDDFMLVKGFCLWEKEAESGGVLGQIMSGNLETVAADKIDGAWTTLRRQIHLSSDSFFENLDLGKKAWMHSAGDKVTEENTKGARTVFGSSVGVDELADRALSTWIKIHLLENDSNSTD